jgi:Ala-tRNA(Pro) deacylase
MTDRDLQAGRVFDVLTALGIPYQRVDHPPVATVDEAEVHWAGIDAMPCRNLFLRNRKGDRHYLIVLGHRKPLDLRALAQQIGDDRLSFASPERLMRHLGVTPGSVSPFGLINDRDHLVRVVVDAELKRAPFVAFHPNVNTITVRLSGADFATFLGWSGHAVRWIAL